MRFRGHTCVYCANSAADTSDHVVCREFFLKDRRQDLPQVPACRSCNNAKAELEHYLTAVLAFGGRHPDAIANLSTLVPKRLARNLKLQRELAAGFAKSGGTTIPVDRKRVFKLFEMVARGLAWHHWRVLLKDGHAALASTFYDESEPFFDQMLSQWRTPRRVSGNLGKNTFTYQGAQATDCPEMTLWRFWMYDGVIFGGGPLVSEVASVMIAVTGPSGLIQKLRNKDQAKRKVGRNEPCPCGSEKKYKKCCGA